MGWHSDITFQQREKIVEDTWSTVTFYFYHEIFEAGNEDIISYLQSDISDKKPDYPVMRGARPGQAKQEVTHNFYTQWASDPGLLWPVGD